MYSIPHFGCNYIFYIPRVQEFFRDRKQARVQGSDKLGPSLPGMNRPQRAEIREECFIIIPLSSDSSPKVVFIRHSGFPDSNLPRVCLENLRETPPRGRKRVVDITD